MDSRIERAVARATNTWDHGLSSKERDLYLACGFEPNEQAVAFQIMLANKARTPFKDHLKWAARKMAHKASTPQRLEAMDIPLRRVERTARRTARKVARDPETRLGKDATAVLATALEEYAADVMAAAKEHAMSQKRLWVRPQDVRAAAEPVVDLENRWMFWFGIPVPLQQRLREPDGFTFQWWVSKQTMRAGVIIHQLEGSDGPCLHELHAELTACPTLVSCAETIRVDILPRPHVRTEYVFKVLREYTHILSMAPQNPHTAEPWVPPYPFTETHARVRYNEMGAMGLQGIWKEEDLEIGHNAYGLEECKTKFVVSLMETGSDSDEVVVMTEEP